MNKTQLVFYAPTKQTLNANRMPNHHMVKSNIASYLRKLGQEAGIKNHPTPEKAQERLTAILLQEDMKSEKARSRKRMNKQKEEPEIIEQRMLEIDEKYSQYTKPDDIEVDYIFNRFTVKITVFSLTKGRLDPPNFYPTIKPIIDGLTDASWWKDDNFNHLVEVSFVYGGVTDTKSLYKFVLDIEETDKPLFDDETLL